MKIKPEPEGFFDQNRSSGFKPCVNSKRGRLFWHFITCKTTKKQQQQQRKSPITGHEQQKDGENQFFFFFFGLIEMAHDRSTFCRC